MMKAGVLTFHWSNNYGAVLQTFAMIQYLKSQEIDAHVVNYVPQYPRKKVSLENKIKDMLLKILLLPDRKDIALQKERFAQFRRDFFSMTERCDRDGVSGLALDAVICGSDQIWNPNLTGGALEPMYFGDFPSEARKIAYAASIGEKNIREQDREQFTAYLKNFHSISVREEQIVPQIFELTDTPVVNVVDPTLLLEQSAYSDIAAERMIQEPYILIYQNSRNDRVYEIAKQLAEEKHMKVVEVGYRRQFPDPGVKMIECAGPREFLSLYKFADFVVTNTFHGTVFAVQFEKQFISIPLKGRESRVENLAEKLGLTDRLVSNPTAEQVQDLLRNEIDYRDVLEKLCAQRKDSCEFIKKSLL